MCAPAHSRAHNRTKIVKFSESAKGKGSLGWGEVREFRTIRTIRTIKTIRTIRTIKMVADKFPNGLIGLIGLNPSNTSHPLLLRYYVTQLLSPQLKRCIIIIHNPLP